MTPRFPSLNFTYSFIYDKAWHMAFKKPYEFKAGTEQYRKTKKALEAVWNQSKQRKALKRIAELLKLTWQAEPVKIYFVKHLTYSGFSDPLTVRMTPDIPFMIQTIIHEATHVLIIQNDKQVRPGLKYLNKRFPDELPGTRIHLIVNVVADSVLETEVDRKETDRIKAELRKFKGLRRAYEILDGLDSPHNLLDQVVKKFGK